MAKALRYLLPLVCVLALATPEAARGVATTIEPANGPVEITACRAAYGLGFVRVSVDFKNNGSKTATAIRCYFRATDAFGQTLASGTPDRLGTFAPGVAIENSSGSGSVAANVANVVCRVEMVRFADGSEWRGNYASTGLYYPPTPSPTSRPSSNRR